MMHHLELIMKMTMHSYFVVDTLLGYCFLCVTLAISRVCLEKILYNPAADDFDMPKMLISTRKNYYND